MMESSGRERGVQPIMVVGRSGRRYPMTLLGRHAAVEGDAALFALALSGTLGWVGAPRDLIDNPESRARFRALSRAGGALYRIECAFDPVDAMKAVWDLEALDHPARRRAA